MAASARVQRQAQAALRKVLELPESQRQEWLEELGAPDDPVRRETEELLAFANTRTIVGAGPSLLQSDSAGGPLVHTARRVIGARSTWIAAAAVLLITLGFWSHGRIQQATLESRGRELEAALNADVAALRLWIADQHEVLDVLSTHPTLQRTVRPIADRAGVVDPAALAATQAYQDAAEVGGQFNTALGYSGAGIVTATGYHVALDRADTIGLTVTDHSMQFIERSMAGERVFIPPLRLDRFFNEPVGGTMYVILMAPMVDERGEVAATVSFGIQASGRFSGLLEGGTSGATGETYAFDAEGLMLSESRFTEELRATGALSRDGTADAGTQLNLRVTVPATDGGPGAELADGAKRAIAARGAQAAGDSGGVITNAYTNYRGVEVIGAWRWLHDFDFGVVAEMSRAEALEPVRYLDVMAVGLLGVLAVTLGVAIHGVFAASGLRRQIRDLGQYRVVREVGAGGMAKVYLGEHALLRRPTAIKVMNEAWSTQRVTLFQQEVRAASELTHANTIEIYDFGRTDDGVPYYAMEYVDGLNLQELVERHGPLPPERVQHLLEQISGSLTEAHARGIVHCDVKPQNVMLCERGGNHDVVKVLDFGLVRRLEDTAVSAAALGGTPTYMAPERLSNPAEVGPAVDVYSLGALAKFLLTGTTAWTPTEHQASDRTERSGPAAALDVLIDECLAPDPRERLRSAAEVRDRLATISFTEPWTNERAERWWAERPAD